MCLALTSFLSLINVLGMWANNKVDLALEKSHKAGTAIYINAYYFKKKMINEGNGSQSSWYHDCLMAMEILVILATGRNIVLYGHVKPMFLLLKFDFLQTRGNILLDRRSSREKEFHSSGGAGRLSFLLTVACKYKMQMQLDKTWGMGLCIRREVREAKSQRFQFPLQFPLLVFRFHFFMHAGGLVK